MSSNFELGKAVPGPQALDTLGLPNPHPVTYKPFARTYRDGNGRPRGDGYASATWHFDALTHDQLQVFLDLIGDEAGDDIQITTRTDWATDYDDSFMTFDGYVMRPKFGDDYEVEMGRQIYTDITFEFSSLVEVVP